MKNSLLLVILTAIVTTVAVRQFFPKVIEESNVVPFIETKYDTVSTVPDWLQDSIVAWKKRPATTDTVELVLQETIVDTQYIPVNAPPEERPNLWPLLSYHGGSRFGDSAVATTYSVVDGRLGISQVFVPGILTGIEADSNASPRLTFSPFPEPKKPSLLYTLKMIGIGFGTCSILDKL